MLSSAYINLRDKRGDRCCSADETECEECLRIAWKSTVNLNQMPAPRVKVDASDFGPIASVFYEEGSFIGSEVHRFRCLPGTIDPRGPRRRS
jgi:hypothetical protein